jgi:glyoxylase-like metal-dependent hydrolase (beta-lactamase superfamily II)
MFTKRMKIFVLPLFVAIFLLAGSYCEGQDYSNVRVDAIKVSGNVYMLTGAGGNIGVSAGKDGVFMIDASYAPLTEKIKAAIGTFSSKPARFVLTTHWHQDHAGGNEYLAREGAMLVAHENVRKRLGSEQFVEFFNAKVPAMPESALPIITFSRDISFHLNEDDIFIFNIAPSHSDGDAIVHFRRSGVIHTGDLYFNGLYPFIDLSAGGSVDGVIAVIKKIMDICDSNTKVIPGHGPLSDRAGLEAYLKMLVAIRDNIASEIKAGKTLDEVIASKPTRVFDPIWGKGFLKPEQFVKIVYSSLLLKI